MLEALMDVFSLNTFITAINVFILFLVAGYFGSPMVSGMLNKRRDAISEEREQSKADMEEAERLRAEYEAKLITVDKEAEAIVSTARDTAKHREMVQLEQAQAEAARIIERANVEAVLEKKRVSDEIKQEIIDTASVAAAKVLAHNIDSKLSDELIDKTLNEMGEGVWQS